MKVDELDLSKHKCLGRYLPYENVRLFAKGLIRGDAGAEAFFGPEWRSSFFYGVRVCIRYMGIDRVVGHGTPLESGKLNGSWIVWLPVDLVECKNHINPKPLSPKPQGLGTISWTGDLEAVQRMLP